MIRVCSCVRAAIVVAVTALLASCTPPGTGGQTHSMLQVATVIAAANPELLAPATPATLGDTTVDGSWSAENHVLVSEGAGRTAAVGADASAGVTVSTPGASIGLRPIGAAATTASAVVNSSAVLFPNISDGADLVVRPTSTGASQAIVASTAAAVSRTQLWDVALDVDQQLVELSNGSVAVVGPDVPTTAPDASETYEAETPLPANQIFKGYSTDEVDVDETPAPDVELVAPEQLTIGGLGAVGAGEGHTAAEGTLASAQSQVAGQVLAVIPPPTLTDAAGQQRALSMSADGTSISVEPPPSDSGLVLPATTTLGLVMSPTAAAAAVRPATFGIAEPRPDELSGPTLAALKASPFRARFARMILEPGAVTGGPGTWTGDLRFEARLAAAEAAGLELVVSPNLGCRPNANGGVPTFETAAEFGERMGVLMRRYAGRVRFWTTPNEPNHAVPGERCSGLPGGAQLAGVKNINPYTSSSRAADAAQYWVRQSLALVLAQVQGVCRDCRIIAGEFDGNAWSVQAKWITNYAKAVMSLASKNSLVPPARWSIHAYADVNTKPPARTTVQAMIDALKPIVGKVDLWLTEQGVQLRRGNFTRTLLDGNRTAQANAAKRLRELAKIPEVSHVFYYQASTPAASRAGGASGFDSSFFDAGGKPRVSYCVLVAGRNDCSTNTNYSATTTSVSAAASWSRDLSCTEVPHAPPQCFGDAATSLSGRTATIDLDGAGGARGLTKSGYFGCLIDADTRAQCFGLNFYGELGRGEITAGVPNPGGPRLPPLAFGLGPVSGLVGVTDIGLGFNHACAIATGGKVWCWGSNYYGQLGNGAVLDTPPGTQERSPVPVVGLSSAVALQVWGNSSCALLANGQIACWGNAPFGDYQVNSSVPHFTSWAERATQLVGTCAVLDTGAVRCWTHSGSIYDVPGVSGARSLSPISPGARDQCAVIAGGAVRCWNPGNFFPTQEVRTIAGITDAVSVTTGETSACAVVANGTVRCWGLNGSGQLGNGTTTDSPHTGVTVAGLSGATATFSGSDYNCALADGAVSCWGNNARGQLGDGTTTSSSIPVGVVGLS